MEIKKCTALHKWENKEMEGVLIENMDDVEQYSNIIQFYGEKAIKKILKNGINNIPPDHLITGMQGHEKGLSMFAHYKATFNQSNTLREMDGAVNQYLDSLIKIVNNFDKAFINVNGGIMPVKDDLMEIRNVENIKWKSDKRSSYVIRKNTKVINLENDPCLERKAVDYMKEVLETNSKYSFENEYSFIKELILFDKEDLKNVFEEFIEKGGETVFVYTTGRNVQQMYDYSNAAIEAGLNHFIFDFNSGTNEEIDNFVEWLKEQGAKVDLVNVEEELENKK